MRYPPRSFKPVGKVFSIEETIGDRLKKLARASLPRIMENIDEPRGRGEPRYCVCGERLHTNPKVRQGRPVCDECAKIIPRLPGGKR